MGGDRDKSRPASNGGLWKALENAGLAVGDSAHDASVDNGHGRFGPPSDRSPTAPPVPFDGLYDHSDGFAPEFMAGPGGGGGSPAAKPKAVPGLAGYEVVPDKYQGQLKPGQMRQSDHDELAKYGFGQLKVLEESEAKKKSGKLGNDEMTQEQFEKLSRSWLNISAGQGMKLQGEKPEDVAEFKRMMSETMRDSPTMRALLTETGSETDPNKAIDVKLGHNQPDVLVDSFPRKLVDLEDLERLPSAHDANLEKNEVTRGEQIVHFLRERRDAASIAETRRKAGQSQLPEGVLFDAAHVSGLAAQNSYRAERGQNAVVGSVMHPIANTLDALTEYDLDDGTAEYVKTVQRGRIERIVPPGPKIIP